MTLLYILFILISLLPYSQPQTTTHYFQFGGNYVIQCEIMNPHINVSWYKDSVHISTLNLNKVYVGNNGSLNFTYYTFAHTGYYLCENATFGFQLFVVCGSNAGEIVSDMRSTCECDSGHYRNLTAVSYTCLECPKSTYKPHPGDHACFTCPTSRVTLSEGETVISKCVCLPGFGTISPSELCIPCPADYFQPYAEYTPCIQCPTYSGTPPAQGEADPEGYTRKADCVCQFSKGNADNSTCYAFVTNANILISNITQSLMVVSFDRQLFARAEDGSLQGNIDRYYVELSTASTVIKSQSLNDLTDLYTIQLTFTGLESGVEYSVSVWAYVRDMEGEPSLVIVTTESPTNITSPSITTTTIMVTTIMVTTPSIASLPTLPSNGVLTYSLIFVYFMTVQVSYHFPASIFTNI